MGRNDDASLCWGIYRNIPFTILGILIITLFYRSAKEKIPMIGMLMMPKTCAYVWTVLIGFHAMRKELSSAE